MFYFYTNGTLIASDSLIGIYNKCYRKMNQFLCHLMHLAPFISKSKQKNTNTPKA